MDQQKIISGFSKLSKREKLKWVVKNFFKNPDVVMKEMTSYWLRDEAQQRVLEGFSENTLTNFPLPYGVAPNFLINGRTYAIPMVIEESSVVAAAAAAAKYWLARGGFKAEVIDTVKLGQVHFKWAGDVQKLRSVFPELEHQLRTDTAELTANMEKRGGGILDFQLRDFSAEEPDYYQLLVSFETCDSMGANFINSCLEAFAQTLERFLATHPIFSNSEQDVNIIMAILSNYTPNCLVRASVSCAVEELGDFCQGSMSAAQFAQNFAQAVRIAAIDPYRATTHNKGIFNGVDAVVLATGNDFRAVEAAGHTYAARDGQYRSLSYCSVENGVFKFWLDLPLALGTVGGLTRLHPIAKRSLELLGNPSAQELMEIVGVMGLAQNFAAVRSLVTTGIQAGHMKMHLQNILNHLEANPKEIAAAEAHFADLAVSHAKVRDFILAQRSTAV